jgi:hypothetical protein
MVDLFSSQRLVELERSPPAGFAAYHSDMPLGLNDRRLSSATFPHSKPEGGAPMATLTLRDEHPIPPIGAL